MSCICKISAFLILAATLISCGGNENTTPVDPIDPGQDETPELSLAKGTVKILTWNLAKGMYADQGNNYDNFAAYIKSVDPDVCIFNEGGTQYYANSDKVEMPVDERPLPEGWEKLASRYGHSSALYFRKSKSSVSVQVITSKKSLKGLTYADLATRWVLVEAETPIGNIYCVDSHLYSTWGSAYDSNRLAEVQSILSATRNNSTYKSMPFWLWCGDFNTQASSDKAYYETYAPSLDVGYEPIDYLLANSDYVDSWASKHPGRFEYTAASKTRKDFVFLSPRLYEVCESCEILTDADALSDHRPQLVVLTVK